MDKVKEYFQTKAISNSLLSMLFNPRWVKLKIENPEIEDDDKKHLRIGLALDCLLTDRGRWEKDFEVVDAVRPFGLMGKFVDHLPGELTIESPKSLYQEAYDRSGYKMNLDKVVQKFWENKDAQGYYLATRNLPENKMILSRDEFDSVTKAKELIQANEFLYKHFYDLEMHIELMHQVVVLFRYMDEDCKGILDGIMINHADRTIQAFDLKTTGKSVYEFPTAFLQWGYYRQCAFYDLALRSETSPVKKYLDEGYTMLDFIFIVVETKVSSSHPAVIYRTTENDRHCGLHGGKVGRRYYKGINELILNFKFHRDNNYWDLPQDLLEAKGEIVLDVFNDAKELVIPITDDEV